MKTEKIAQLGICTTLALILSYVETLIPLFIGIPGAKLGLANLILVYVLYRMNEKDALLVSVMRILLSGFMFGNMMSIIFSLTGMLFSFCVMVLMKKTDGFSVLGVSTAGGCMHNIGQLSVALVVTQTKGLVYYIPFLLLTGLGTGLLIGILVKLMLHHIPKSLF